MLEVNMAEESLIEGEDENILYDLLVITEWPPETDTQVSQPSVFYTLYLLCGCLVVRLIVKNVPSK